MSGVLFTPNPVLGNTAVLSDQVEVDRVVLQNTHGATSNTFFLHQGRSLEIEGFEPGVYFASLFHGTRLVGTDKLVILRR